MKEKLLGVFLLLVAVGVGLFTFFIDVDSKSKPTKALTFSELVSEDLEQIKKNDEKRKTKVFPDSWSSIQNVAYNFHTDFQKKLMRDQKLKVPETLSGTHRLEVEFIDVPDKESPALILQFSLIELASNNKVWELGRMYSLASFLEKTKEENREKPPETKEAPQDKKLDPQTKKPG